MSYQHHMSYAVPNPIMVVDNTLSKMAEEEELNRAKETIKIYRKELDKTISDFPSHLKNAIYNYLNIILPACGYTKYNNYYSGPAQLERILYFCKNNKNNLLLWYDCFFKSFDKTNLKTMISGSACYAIDVDNGQYFSLFRDFLKEILKYLFERNIVDYKTLPYYLVKDFLNNSKSVGKKDDYENFKLFDEIFDFWENECEIAKTTDSIDKIDILSNNINYNIIQNLILNKNVSDDLAIKLIDEFRSILNAIDYHEIVSNICRQSTSSVVLKHLIEKGFSTYFDSPVVSLLANHTYYDNYDLVTNYNILSIYNIFELAQITKSEQIINLLASFDENEDTDQIFLYLSKNKNLTQYAIDKIMSHKSLNAKLILINNDGITLDKDIVSKLLDDEEARIDKNPFLYKSFNISSIERHTSYIMKYQFASDKRTLNDSNLLDRLLNDKDAVVRTKMKQTLDSVLDLI